MDCPHGLESDYCDECALERELSMKKKIEALENLVSALQIKNATFESVNAVYKENLERVQKHLQYVVHEINKTDFLTAQADQDLVQLSGAALAWARLRNEPSGKEALEELKAVAVKYLGAVLEVRKKKGLPTS